MSGGGEGSKRRGKEGSASGESEVRVDSDGRVCVYVC